PPGGWQLKVQAGLARPVASDGVLFLGCRDGALVALDPSSGRQRWSFQTGIGLPVEGAPAIVTSAKGAFGGRANIEATPVVFDSIVYVSSFDGYLYALDAISGSLRWR